MYKGNDALITGSLQYATYAPDHTYTEMYFYKLHYNK